jgi:hypothetical protein
MKIVVGILAAALLSGCMTWNRGAEPTNPKYGSMSWSENVNSLTPRLEWMPNTVDSNKQGFRYQLQILDGNTVHLFKDDIHDPQYLVDQPLLPNREYQWMVRSAWTVNGRTEGNNWSDKKYFYISPILVGWGAKTYRFKTPNVTQQTADTMPAASATSVVSAVQKSSQEDTVRQPAVIANKKDDVAATSKSQAQVRSKSVVSLQEDSERLEKLQRLKDRGLITEDDYRAKKNQILEKL